MTNHPSESISKADLSNFVTQFADQSQFSSLVIDCNVEGNIIVHCNTALEQLTGYSKAHLIDQTLACFNGIKTESESIEQLNLLLDQRVSFHLKLIHYKMDGTAFWNEITCHPIHDDQLNKHYLILHFKDVTISSLSRMISKLEREIYEHFENDNDVHSICQLITDKVEKHYIHDAYCTIELMQADDTLDLMGTSSLPYRLAKQLSKQNEAQKDLYTEDKIYIEDDLQKTFIRFDHVDIEQSISISTKWVKPMFSKSKRLRGFITLYFERKAKIQDLDTYFLNRIGPAIMLANRYGEQKKELQRLAYFDVETNIPNAHYFKMKLNEWVQQGKKGLIILIQPGEYSRIVDLYGRSIGDELLKQIVDRLNTHNKKHIELIARFSNSLIIAVEYDQSEANKYDLRIRPLTIIPYILAEKETYISLKIGVGYFDQETTIDESIRQADLALSKSRQISGTTTSYFESENNKQLQQEMDTLNQLTYGLKNDEFTINLQPKMNINTGKIDGFEALSRWNSKVLGNVAPNVFIPIAEQAGYIKQIDTVVLRKVLNWLSIRYQLGQRIVPVAVNISPDHFYDVNFISTIQQLVQSYSVPPNYLKLELTESIELVDFNRAKDILDELKKLGIDCSIDDFGVGYSSLSYLPKLPFSEIKIDRSFVNAIHDNGMYAVIQTIIQLATNLQMKAVAEGIETLEQYIMLKNMGCHTGQGFYLHKPMPLDVASALLDNTQN